MNDIRNKEKTGRGYRSLTLLLTIAFLVLSLTILIMASGMELLVTFKQQQLYIDRQQKYIARSAATSVHSYINKRINLLIAAVRLGNVLHPSVKKRKEVLDKLIGLESSFSKIILLDSMQNDILHVTRKSRFVKNTVSEERKLEEIKKNTASVLKDGKTYISPVFIDEVTFEPLIVVAVPVTNIFGDYSGVLAAEVDLIFMWNLIDRMKIGRSGLVYVVDGKGNLIAARDISRVLKQENMKDITVVADFLQGADTSTEHPAKISRGFNGNIVISDYMCLDVPDWAVVVELPIAEALEPVINKIKITIGIIAISFLVALLIGIYLSKRITRPIIMLKNAATEIGRGKFDTRIEIATANEIGKLAQTFNQMANDLRRTTTSIDNLNNEIEERQRIEDELRKNEAFLRSIYMAAPIGIAVAEERKLFSINRRVCEITGYSEDEINGMNTRIFYENEDDYQNVGKMLYGDLKKNDRISIETRMRRKDGVLIDTQISAVAIEGSNRSVVTLSDITERKKMERSLVESENNFRRMFEISSEGIALIDPETGGFIAVNPAMCELFGLSEEDISTLLPEDLTPEETIEDMKKYMRILASGEDVPDHEGISMKKDGTKINVIISNRSMLWNGKPVYFITFKNITYLKEIQEKLRLKNLEILEFMNMVTHDLRKPLSAMSIIFNLAGHNAFGVLNDDGIEAVKTGSKSAKYMQDILEDLMACARLESGTQELEYKDVKFMSLVTEVISRLKYQFEERNIVIETCGDDIQVRVDEKQMTRVLINLVSNAVNYIGNGSNKKIRIGWNESGGKPVFFVEDNGIGVPLESQKDLFQKFKRGNNVSGISGTGLGLAIVKSIIETHGGTIWMESEEGKGTTVFYTLGSSRIKAV